MESDRIQELKDEIVRLTQIISQTQRDKKLEAKAFNNLIKEKKIERDVHLAELAELEARK